MKLAQLSDGQITLLCFMLLQDTQLVQVVTHNNYDELRLVRFIFNPRLKNE